MPGINKKAITLKPQFNAKAVGNDLVSAHHNHTNHVNAGNPDDVDHINENPHSDFCSGNVCFPGLTLPEAKVKMLEQLQKNIDDLTDLYNKLKR